jgi:hypothetical protein
MNPPNLKEEAHRLVDRLSDNASWDDLMREIYVRQAIESGLRDSEQGRVVSLEEVRAKFGLGPQCAQVTLTGCDSEFNHCGF